MRLKSEIFVSALIRLAETQGAIAVLRRRGAQEAGTVFIKLDCLDGRTALYGPAAQSELPPEGVDRLFTRLHKEQWVDSHDTEASLSREIKFDPDIWVVEIEDRYGRLFVDVTN
jgi:hypothetical protein